MLRHALLPAYVLRRPPRLQLLQRPNDLRLAVLSLRQNSTPPSAESYTLSCGLRGAGHPLLVEVSRKRPILTVYDEVWVVEEDGLCGHFCLCPRRGIVDTSNELVSVRVAGAKKRRRSVEERRKIVEATLQPGASVSRVARRHDVNANQVFHWRKLYREGRLGSSTSTKLLPVKVTDERSVREAEGDGIAWRSGTIEIQLPKGTLRIAGAVDVAALRAALECLAG